MNQKKTLTLQFYTSSSDHFQPDILSTAQYSKSNKINSPIINNAKQRWNSVYPFITKIRSQLKAPVDQFGTQNLFDQNAPQQDKQFQILIALILSAQTKDQTTAKCMNRLLKLPCNQVKIQLMNLDEIKNLIYEVNYNKVKAQRIYDLARIDKMPETYEDTIKIKGVGEKMALLYMQIAFNETLGIAVDVNIIRVVSRIGLSYEKSPSKIRRDLESMIDKDKWSEVNQLLVGFGQDVCKPKQDCNKCPLRPYCEYYKQNNKIG